MKFPRGFNPDNYYEHFTSLDRIEIVYGIIPKNMLRTPWDIVCRFYFNKEKKIIHIVFSDVKPIQFKGLHMIGNN